MSSLPHTKPGEVRIEAYAGMPPAHAQKLRAQILDKLKDLPQARYINEVDAEIWVDSVLEREPERAWWHYERLFGIGGSEIGVFLGSEQGKFHPFTTPRKLSAGKLLRAPLEATNGDMQRGTAMEPLAQGEYRKMVIARGGRAREDLMEQMKGYFDPEHPWLVGNPDDIVEENGKIYIVDYKVPNPEQIEHYDTTGVPFYYAAQVHHYRLIAEKCGIHIDGLRLCSLNTKEWRIDERPVPYNQEMTDDIIAVGDKFWFEHIMTGKLPATLTLKNTRSIEDLALERTEYPERDLDSVGPKGAPVYLRDENEEVIVREVSGEELKGTLLELSGMFNAWSQASLMADEMRKMGQQVLAERLPVDAFPVGMDKVELGSANLVVKRAFKEEAVVGAVREKLASLNMAEDKIEEVLKSDNFWAPQVMAADKLAELIKMHLDVDVLTDERFASAVAVPAQRRMDTMLALLQEMDVDKTVDYATLMEPSQSSVKFELNREPFSGPFAKLKDQVRDELRQGVLPTIHKVALSYARDRGALVEERRIVDAALAADKQRQKAEREARLAEEAKRRQQAQEDRAAKAAAKAAAPPAPRRRRSP